MKKKLISIVVILFVFTACGSESEGYESYSEENITTFDEYVPEPTPAPTPAPHLVANSHGEILKHFLGSAVNTGTNNGFTGSNIIGERDSHFGWELGRFFISGYTRVTGDRNAPVFIRTLGDEITLNFNLTQDIDALNGNSNLTIADLSNAFDVHFGIERTYFGRGTLIIRHTDWRNYTGAPVIFTDYLSAITVNADTLVMFLEEGDYEVALNYATREAGWFGSGLFASTNNYRIFFTFSVRNGESMVFPRDVVTGAELTNRSVTPHGFYLDLARSRFLDIDIRREVLVQGADGLTEDTRFNRPARDGVQYTADGIYTITARNRYTNQETVKRIYVGTNHVLIAHMNTGYSISEINEMIALGAIITDEGDIVLPEGDIVTPLADVDNNYTEDAHELEHTQDEELLINEPTTEQMDFVMIAIIAGMGIAIIVLIFMLLRLHRKKTPSDPQKRESEGDGE